MNKKAPNQAAREAAAAARLAALDSPERPILALFAAAVIARDIELAESVLDAYESRILRKQREATRKAILGSYEERIARKNREANR